MSDRSSGEDRKKERFEAEAMVHLDALYRTALRMTKHENDADDGEERRGRESVAEDPPKSIPAAVSMAGRCV